MSSFQAQSFKQYFGPVSCPLRPRSPQQRASRLGEVTAKFSFSSTVPRPFTLDNVNCGSHCLGTCIPTMPFKCHRLHFLSRYSNDLCVVLCIQNGDVISLETPETIQVLM